MLNPLCNRLIHLGKLSYGNHTKNELQYELPKSEKQEHCWIEIFLAPSTAQEELCTVQFFLSGTLYLWNFLLPDLSVKKHSNHDPGQLN